MKVCGACSIMQGGGPGIINEQSAPGLKQRAHVSVCLALRVSLSSSTWGASLHRPGTVLRTHKGRPGASGAWLAKHTTQTGKLLSSPARQQHLFVLCAVIGARWCKHALVQPQRTSTAEGGRGIKLYPTLNATQSALCARCTKAAVVKSETMKI